MIWTLVFGILLLQASVIKGNTNIAVGKPTAQSSEGFGGHSSRGVDGGTNQHWGGASCTHTNAEANPWWAVDLQQDYDISKVVIYNRQDCCGERLRAVQVYTTTTMPNPGNPPRATDAGAELCGSFPGPSSNGAVVEIACSGGTSGRYLVVQLGVTEYLTLCEVNVIGELSDGSRVAAGSGAATNVAVGKLTSQSSEGFGGNSARGVDGNPNQQWGGASCTHTNAEPNPWWAVDLGEVYDLSQVIIYNRADCCGNRLRAVKVYTSPFMPSSGSPPNVATPGSLSCGAFAGPSSNGAVVEINCNAGTYGRYLVVQLATTEYLTLCEVQVMGVTSSARVQVLANVAPGKPTSQSSTGFGGIAARGVDGNTNPQWGGSSCTHTNAEPNPWWAVDLQQSYDIDSVVIYNRQDCCGNRLRNVQVYMAESMPSTGSPPSITATGSVRCGTYGGPAANGDVVQIPCNSGTVGQYLVVQLTVSEYLTLCEVQVLSGGAASLSGGGGDCEASEALQAEVDSLKAALAAAQAAQAAAEEAQADAARALAAAEQAKANAEQAKAAAERAKADAESAVTSCRSEVDQLKEDLAEATSIPDPVIPTASPTATLSATAHEFTLPINGIKYILEMTERHIAREADDFCEQYGMKLAQVENIETLAALSTQFKAIKAGGTSITEVATGERSAVNMDRDVPTNAFNAAGWSCVTIVPDGEDFKLVSKKCDGRRALLCAAVPLYC